MFTPEQPFADFPIDNVQASSSLFITHFNREIGDRMMEISQGVNFSSLEFFDNRTNSCLVMLGLATVMQYVEFLTDAQAAEATGSRMDWKYALHLPVHFPGLEPRVLQEFRQEISSNQAGLQIFQLLLENLADGGLLGSRGKQRILAKEVLTAINFINRIAQSIDAMSRAVETLAADQPEWLRINSKPHWFRKYRSEDKNYFLPHQKEQQELMENEINNDITHLLDTIIKGNDPAIINLPEIQNLQKLAGK